MFRHLIFLYHICASLISPSERIDRYPFQPFLIREEEIRISFNHNRLTQQTKTLHHNSLRNTKLVITFCNVIHYFYRAVVPEERESLKSFVFLNRYPSQPVLDYSGEHNISITTNPYGFYLLFPCYLLFRAYALPKIRFPNQGRSYTKLVRIRV